MIKKEIELVANYNVFAADTESIARFMKNCLKMTGSIGQFINKSGNIKKKFIPIFLQLIRKNKNAHLLSLAGIRSWSGHNIVPSVLRETMAEMVVGNTVTPTMVANYMALGSGNATPSNSDIALETETVRETFTEKFAVDNVAYLDKFFSKDIVGGNTYLEAGVFVDGTAASNSGYLLSRILINEVLSSTENLTVNVSITFA